MRTAGTLAFALVTLARTAVPAAAARAASDATVYVDFSAAPSTLVYRAGSGQANTVTFGRRGRQRLRRRLRPRR